MAQFESTRLAVARRRARTDSLDSRAELLDVLASGSPPAFASDSRDRIVFWNDGARELLGKRADEMIGKRCYEAICGRDVFGNKFCYANCPVVATSRAGEKVNAFELDLRASTGNPDTPLVNVTVLKVPSLRDDLYTMVHILQPIEVSSRHARSVSVTGDVPAPAPLPAVAQAPREVPPLTNREVEILRWVAQGLQNRDIAQRLDLSLATVRNHIHNILEKLGVHSKLEAVSLAFRSGWVGTSDGPPS